MPPRTGAEAAEPPAGPARATSAGRRRQAAALLAGAGLLGLLLYYTGLEELLARLGQLGWSAPLVLVPFAVINVCTTIAWRWVFPARAAARVPLAHLYLVRMAGEAVNSITPTATVGGEPVKVQLLRPWGVGASDGMASVVIAKTTLTVAQIAFILIGLVLLFERLHMRLVGVLWVGLLIVVAAGFTLLLVRLQSRGPTTTVWRWLRRIAPRARLLERLEPKAHEIDERLADFYRMERGAALSSTLLNLLGWLLGALEVQLMMYLIGAPVSLGDALMVEALSQPIRATAILVPGALGTQEIGGTALCTFLGIAEADGAALWLLKRARETIFDAVGVLYLARRTAGRG
jgi:putative membrane protein